MWQVENADCPNVLLRNLGNILYETDRLVIGSYELNEESKNLIMSMGRHDLVLEAPYFETFDFNLDEYPEGRAWDVLASKQNLAELAISVDGGGQTGFDHLLAYRPGKPVLPLFNYHDSFKGGDMLISGLYSENMIINFCEKINSKYKLVRNPELK